jgi:hypothetical protein
MEVMSREIATPFAAFVADDDFLCLQGLERSMRFLEGHPDYSAAHGKALILQVEGGAPYGPITTVRLYPQAVLTRETGAARLEELFANPCALLYAVHRTATWREMLSGLSQLTGVRNRNMFKDELIPTCVSVVRGKVMELEGLHLVRQTHEQRLPFPPPFDWLTDPAWNPSYQVFLARIAEELARQDGLSGDEARAVVRRVFWGFLARMIGSAWSREQDGKSAAPARDGLRQRLAAIPVARAVWRMVRRWQPLASGVVAPSALRDPAGPWAASFGPIARVIGARPQVRWAEQPQVLVAGGEA